MLEISDLGNKGILHVYSENKGADQLCGYRDLRLYMQKQFLIYNNDVSSLVLLTEAGASVT